MIMEKRGIRRIRWEVAHLKERQMMTIRENELKLSNNFDTTFRQNLIN